MKQILILGAGKSSAVLIKYLSKQALLYNWTITVADQSETLIREKILSLPHTVALLLDPTDLTQRNISITESDLVISMLPPSMHFEVAKVCLGFNKPLLTASYLTPEIMGLNAQAVEIGIPILMEMGLDPGLDHMSAMKEIDAIKNAGGHIYSFKSYTGGLMAPEYDDNPWNYKITWNPKNVVLAGQGTVKYLYSDSFKYIPYQSVFSRLEPLEVKPYGKFEGYANRDSLKYIKTYGLEGISTFMRGTLRRPGYCSAWNALVKTGLTDDSFRIENSKGMHIQDLVKAFLPEDIEDVERSFYEMAGIRPDSPEAIKLRWLGLFSDEKILRDHATPAEILQEILEKKWVLGPFDKDMIVMQHEIKYTISGKNKKLTSSLAYIGEDKMFTAMASTVGLPLGIAATLLLTETLILKGVHIPVKDEIYIPILRELEKNQIHFNIVEEDIKK